MLSAFIDGTAIYGTNSDTSAQLRTFTNGTLKTSAGMSGATSSLVPNQSLTNRTYLPISSDTCSTSTNPLYKCFQAGEFRTSENLGLVGMQTLFNREHNRVAAELLKVNPNWSDETLYQEARRIVIAELQHVTYNEFVPVFRNDSSLSPLKTNTAYYTGYNASLSPQLTGEFATAAFRMGHSMIRHVMSRSDVNQTFNVFKNAYFNSFNFYQNTFQTDMAYK